jgi:hypothetical protein
MRVTKESNDFTLVKSLADYHICEQFVTLWLAVYIRLFLFIYRPRFHFLSWVPGFDEHLENGNRFTYLKPATDRALAM